METYTILDDIPVHVTSEEVLASMQMTDRKHSFQTIIDELVDVARTVAKPKVLYRVSYIEETRGEGVAVDGVLFQSPVLRMNLQNVERVFPYIATAGRELDSIPVSGDIMHVYCLDIIKEMVLDKSLRYFETRLTDTYALGKMAHMNPGSLADWPISQQEPLFSLFDDVEALIGVRLTESFLMDPIKSVSGIYFPAEIDFKSCMLCTRHPCRKRRAPYNPAVAEKYSGK
jgi:hypothetical protein